MSKRGKTAGIALKKDDESSELVIKSEADDDRLNDVRGFNGCFVSETWLDATLPSGMALGDRASLPEEVTAPDVSCQHIRSSIG